MELTPFVKIITLMILCKICSRYLLIIYTKFKIFQIFSMPSPQLVDIAAATQTPGAQKALLELLNFEHESAITYQERYLLAAAFSTHPGDYLLKDLLVCMCVGARSEKKKKQIKSVYKGHPNDGFF